MTAKSVPQAEIDAALAWIEKMRDALPFFEKNAISDDDCLKIVTGVLTAAAAAKQAT